MFLHSLSYYRPILNPGDPTEQIIAYSIRYLAKKEMTVNFHRQYKHSELEHRLPQLSHVASIVPMETSTTPTSTLPLPLSPSPPTPHVSPPSLPPTPHVSPSSSMAVIPFDPSKDVEKTGILSATSQMPTTTSSAPSQPVSSSSDPLPEIYPNFNDEEEGKSITVSGDSAKTYYTTELLTESQLLRRHFQTLSPSQGEDVLNTMIKHMALLY